MKNNATDVVDFHSHILPRVDHGSASLGMSLEQLRYAAKANVKRIIATPHFYPDTHLLDSFLAKRDTAYEQLIAALPTGMPEVRLGAEILLCEKFCRFPGLDKLCVQGTNTLLIELPVSLGNFDYVTTVAKICDMGYSVVLAHAERYSPEYIESFIEVGAKVQLNAPAFWSLLFRRTRNRWIRDNIIVALGSDIHSLDKDAYVNFNKAKSKMGKYVDFLASYSENYWK